MTVTAIASPPGDAYRIAVGSELAALELTLAGFEVLFGDGFE